MPAPRWLRRVWLFAPAAGCALLTAVFVIVSTWSSMLECDRAADRCTWSTSSLTGGRVQEFAIAQVREVRLVTELGKHKRDAETALIFASGHELRLARGKEAAARARHASIEAFFAGRMSRLRDGTSGARWLLLAAVVLAAATVVLAVRGMRTRVLGTVAAPVASRPWHARREVRLLLGVAALALVVQAAFLIVASQTQGTLELECRQRCRFGGGECLPGGSLRSSLDPGDYTIEVWTGAGPDLWRPQTFTIALGEVTRVTCE